MLIFADEHDSILSLPINTLQVYIFAIKHCMYYNIHFLIK